jgi:hypothetical protein
MSNKKKTVAPKPNLSPTTYIKTKSRSLPWGKCYINDNWQLMGMAVIVLSRVQPSGKLIIGIYIVDTKCLGLKNTGLRFGLDPGDFDDFLEKTYSPSQLTQEAAHPLLLQNIIYGAIEYAEDLGFEPNKGFLTTEYILDPADKIGYIDIEFGQDGQPCYVQGPHDNPYFILAKLDRKLGAGNYLFFSQIDQSKYSENLMFDSSDTDEDDDENTDEDDNKN